MVLTIRVGIRDTDTLNVRYKAVGILAEVVVGSAVGKLGVVAVLVASVVAMGEFLVLCLLVAGCSRGSACTRGGGCIWHI